VGHLLASPLRRFAQDPAKILGAHVTPGMTVLDVGCATGFFSLPLARLVGPGGRVVCADLQEPLLRALERRARRAGVAGGIRCRIEVLGHVVQLAHHHSIRGASEEDYFAEPQVTVNRDFTRLLFTSNWEHYGTAEVEVYLIALPEGWLDRLP